MCVYVCVCVWGGGGGGGGGSIGGIAGQRQGRAGIRVWVTCVIKTPSTGCLVS